MWNIFPRRGSGRPEQIEPNPASIRVLKRVAGTVSSHLGEESRVKAEQACFLPCTDDNIPVIGEIPGMKGCYVATGHSCWGILNGSDLLMLPPLFSNFPFYKKP
ncbi:putative D-amino-acid oxidase [Helianthus annuus]|nr:putative D-amino-acid oxidase [Helianthus annuus]